MTARKPAPRMELVPDPHEAKRVRTTLLCTDADGIPKVSNAGELFEQDGVKVQMMHNGVMIEEGCYGGQWMTEIIRSLHGHHEPQEEVVFDTMVRRLAESTTDPTMIELGSFWAYYSMWFASALDGARVTAIEPDPHNFEVGIRNARLNALEDRISFSRGAVGREPGSTFIFEAESDGREYEVEQVDLSSVMQRAELDHVDLLLADIQGAETVLLDRAAADFAAGRVRFLVLSTHHNSISGDALTHQRCLLALKAAGAHIIAEHSVSESFSGDGLIAASFDDRDKDLAIHVSFCRSKDTIFDEVEFELERAMVKLAEADEVRAELERLRREHELVLTSRTWRWAQPARSAAAALRIRRD